MPGENALSGTTTERRLPGEHLVEHAAERVDVGAPVGGAVSTPLLRAHVFRSPDRDPCSRQGVPIRLRNRLCDPEIRDDCMLTTQQDVAGFDVAMKHVVRVGIRQCVGDFLRDLDRVTQRELLFPANQVAEAFPCHIRHDVIEEAVGDTGVVQREDVRVLKPSLNADFAEESLGAERRGQLGLEHLDRDVAIVLEVVRPIDIGHTAAPDLTVERITVRKRGPQAVNLIHHGGAHAFARWEPGRAGSLPWNRA